MNSQQEIDRLRLDIEYKMGVRSHCKAVAKRYTEEAGKIQIEIIKLRQKTIELEKKDLT